MAGRQVQHVTTNDSIQVVFDRMIQALNRHELEAMVACFAPDYRSEQPFHPERSFRGSDGVRKIWGAFFRTVPDIRAEILRQSVGENTIWVELRFYGTKLDGSPHDVRGVSIQGVQDDRLVWAAMYIEDVR